MSTTETDAERSYEEIMQEMRQKSLERLDVTEEEFSQMTIPEIRERAAQQRDEPQSLLQKLRS